ncbi:MAG TPA: L,D-transpeptidase [Chthoniobacterales bacterium]
MPARFLHLPAIFVALVLLFTGCESVDRDHSILVSVPDQKLRLYYKGHFAAEYPVSTSKFGLGDRRGSNGTPLGHLRIKKKIGDGAPIGAVFKGRKRTGEILRPNAPGRDPIVTRILWLHGLEDQNANAFDRYIYIHGTPEEWRIGTPASYGCIRMRSVDVANLYAQVGRGASVNIVNAPLPSLMPVLPAQPVAPPPVAQPVMPAQPVTPQPLAQATPRQTAGG